MSTVVMHNVLSVDGYIADNNDDVGPLFDITNGWEGRPLAGEHVVVNRVLHLRYRVRRSVGG